MYYKYFKLLSVLIAVVLTLSVFSSCGDSADSKIDSQTAGNDDTTAFTAETTTEDPAKQLNLPEFDFGGYTVNMVTVDRYNDHFKLDSEMTGDALDDAGYNRNLAMSELLNIDFNVTEVNDPPQTFKKSIMAGDNEYDFIFPHATGGVAALVTDHLLYDWNKLEHVDFSKSWWNQSMTNSLGIGNRLYYASGDIVMAWQGMNVILFNKDYLEQINLEKDLYDTCFEGEWTIDYQTKIIKDIATDIDGDGEMTKADKYGLLENKNTGYSYVYASDIRITTPDENGWPKLSLYNEKMINLVQKYYDMIWSGDVTLDEYSSVTYATGSYRDMIIEGRCFLSSLDIGSLYPYLREIEHDFGILPIPKYDEAQEKYRVFCGAGLIGIPVNAPDTSRTGAIAEAMAYYSYQYIRPAFFDIVLENKAVRDENSYKVIRLMHENKVFDFGFNFDSTGSAYNMITEVVIKKKSTDFASYYAKNESKIMKNFQKIIDAVMNED